jgi:acyl-CoA thioester hydrolase
MHEKRIEIRWRDMDAFGHVNNAVFLTYLEECRDELMAEALGAIGTVDDFVLARVAIDFRRSLTQSDDEVIVRCHLTGLGRASVRTREEITLLSGEVAAVADSVMVPVRTGAVGARPISDAEREALQRRLELPSDEPAVTGQETAGQ